MGFINLPEGLTDVEKLIFYRKVIDEAETEINKLKSSTISFLSNNNDFYENGYGKLQRVTRISDKPKETLKVYLEEKGLLEMCKKDEINLGKVKELIEAGVIDEKETFKHIDRKAIPYIKFKAYNE